MRVYLRPHLNFLSFSMSMLCVYTSSCLRAGGREKEREKCRERERESSGDVAMSKLFVCRVRVPDGQPTDPNPLHQRDDLVDRPRAMGIRTHPLLWFSVEVQGFWFRIWFRVSCFELGGLCSGFRVARSGFRVPGSGFWIPGVGCRV